MHHRHRFFLPLPSFPCLFFFFFSFVQELTYVIRSRHPSVILIAEVTPENPEICKGAGFDSCWIHSAYYDAVKVNTSTNSLPFSLSLFFFSLFLSISFLLLLFLFSFVVNMSLSYAELSFVSTAYRSFSIIDLSVCLCMCIDRRIEDRDNVSRKLNR